MTTLFHRLLQAYRASVKRIPGVHRSLYFIGQHVALPLLERWKSFWTIPDDPIYFRLELLLGKYEPETVAFFKRYVRPGMVVLDVGAHVGYYTRLFADLVGPAGLVIAFEPHPVHVQYLKKNIGNRENVQIIPKAVGSEPGTAKIYDSPIESVSSSLTWFENKWEYVKNKNIGEIAPRLNRSEHQTREIEVVRIDDVLEKLGISKIDFLKIDIEGAEVMALKGAEQTLSRSDALVVFELDPANLRGFGYTPAELIGVLQDCGYMTFGVLSDNGLETVSFRKLFDLSAELEAKYSRINCVASKGSLA